MPIYLDEDMVSDDPAEICYPHLDLCMGVTVKMSDGHLVGAHFTKPDTETVVMAELNQQINTYIGKHPGTTVEQLYCTGNFMEHVTKHGGGDVTNKAHALHFHGDAFSFDASLIKPKRGTFVAIRSNGVGKNCGVFYKRDEKVKYGDLSGPMVAQFSTYLKKMRQSATRSGLEEPIHKLHDATHLLQLKHQVIP